MLPEADVHSELEVTAIKSRRRKSSTPVRLQRRNNVDEEYGESSDEDESGVESELEVTENRLRKRKSSTPMRLLRRSNNVTSSSKVVADEEDGESSDRETRQISKDSEVISDDKPASEEQKKDEGIECSLDAGKNPRKKPRKKRKNVLTMKYWRGYRKKRRRVYSDCSKALPSKKRRRTQLQAEELKKRQAIAAEIKRRFKESFANPKKKKKSVPSDEDQTLREPNLAAEEQVPVTSEPDPIVLDRVPVALPQISILPSPFDRGIKLRGRKLRKEVNGKVIRGEVADYDRRNRQYKIRFEDGDEEVVLWKDLERLLDPIEQLRKCQPKQRKLPEVEKEAAEGKPEASESEPHFINVRRYSRKMPDPGNGSERKTDETAISKDEPGISGDDPVISDDDEVYDEREEDDGEDEKEQGCSNASSIKQVTPAEADELTRRRQAIAAELKRKLKESFAISSKHQEQTLPKPDRRAEEQVAVPDPVRLSDKFSLHPDPSSLRSPCYRGIKLRGRKLRKEFNGKVSRGEVVDYDRRKQRYKVRFEDGDDGVLVWKDLKHLLDPIELIRKCQPKQSKLVSDCISVLRFSRRKQETLDVEQDKQADVCESSRGNGEDNIESQEAEKVGDAEMKIQTLPTENDIVITPVERSVTDVKNFPPPRACSEQAHRMCSTSMEMQFPGNDVANISEDKAEISEEKAVVSELESGQEDDDDENEEYEKRTPHEASSPSSTENSNRASGTQGTSLRLRDVFLRSKHQQELAAL